MSVLQQLDAILSELQTFVQSCNTMTGVQFIQFVIYASQKYELQSHHITSEIIYRQIFTDRRTIHDIHRKFKESTHDEILMMLHVNDEAVIVPKMKHRIKLF
ncbi:MAG: hypothetical protein K1X91_10125 [Bacteriodetes bacterium]|nr:hypothetical protein [Bacteroidota bacterium]